MLLLSIVFTLFQSSLVKAFNPITGNLPVKTTIKDGFKIDCYDLNRDSKNDLCFFYDKSNYLAKQETDSDFDGSFELTESFGSLEKFEYLKVKTISNEEKETTLIKEFAGKKFYETTHLKKGQLPSVRIKIIHDQKASKIDCEPTATDKFVKSIKDALIRVKTDKESFYNSDFGLRIHQSCLQKRGQSKAVDELKSALNEGVKCLEQLNTSKAREHIAKIGSLFISEPKPKIICNEKDFDWKGTVAHATADRTSKEHPTISMNPHTCSGFDSLFYKGTFFHELFHNLGYRHNRDPEYATSCDTCCFGDDPAKKEQCELCGSSTKSVKDSKYLKKWADIYYKTNNFPNPSGAINEALEKNPNDPELLGLKLKINSKPFLAPLGAVYLEKQKNKGIKVSEEAAENINFYSKQPYNSILKDSAKAVVDAEEALASGNYKLALETLKKMKKPAISPNESEDNKEFFKFSSQYIRDAEYRLWEAIYEKSYSLKDYSVTILAGENQKRLEALNN